MVRKSLRISSGAATTPAHKRAASGEVPPNAASSKAKKAKSTPTKSQYFDHANGEYQDQVADGSHSDASLSSDDDGNDPDFGGVAELPTSEDDDSDHDNYENEGEKGPKSRKMSTSAKSKSAKSKVSAQTKGGEAWRPGVKTGLSPGTQVIIKKPTARPAGKTPYRDDAIHPNTVLFLADLKANNSREWLKCK